MRHIVFKGYDRILGAPPSWDPKKDEQCGALAIKTGMFADRMPMMTSYWKPDAQELAALNAGAVVGLIIITHFHNHPPVLMQVFAGIEEMTFDGSNLAITDPDQEDRRILFEALDKKKLLDRQQIPLVSPLRIYEVTQAVWDKWSARGLSIRNIHGLSVVIAGDPPALE